MGPTGSGLVPPPAVPTVRGASPKLSRNSISVGVAAPLFVVKKLFGTETRLWLHRRDGLPSPLGDRLIFGLPTPCSTACFQPVRAFFVAIPPLF